MQDAKKIIGICGSRLCEEFYVQITNEINSVAKERGFNTVVFSGNISFVEDTPEVVAHTKICDLIQFLPLAGLVVFAEAIKNDYMIQRIVLLARSRKIPVFCIEGHIDDTYYIGMDYHSGFEDLVRHVIKDHGARRVNMLAGFENNSFSDERIAIYKKVLAENGIEFEPERLRYGQFWERPAKREVRAFLDSDLPLPEAIICANDTMAIATCQVLEERGYRVPDDIIVTGFDGLMLAKYYSPVITTCEPDHHDTVVFIMDEIQKFQQTGEYVPSEYLGNFKMVCHESCGCHHNETVNRNVQISQLSADFDDCGWHSLAMNQMLTATFGKQSVKEVAQILPISERMWSDHFRFACVKAEIVEDGNVPMEFGEMSTILRGDNGIFETPGENFSIEKVIPHFSEVDQDYSLFVIQVLCSGQTVYGYAIESFSEISKRNIQRTNEFCMFLSQAINLVLHNQEMNKLNSSLSEAYQEIAMMSLSDSMTGLLNRRGFSQKFSELFIREQGHYLTVLSIDMNRLKYINDTFGHADGDFAIITLANAIVSIFGEQSLCARFGGDEFACAIVTCDPDYIDEQQILKRLESRIQSTEGVSEKPYTITASIGMYSEEITLDTDIERMIREADQRMYVNKREAHRNDHMDEE